MSKFVLAAASVLVLAACGERRAEEAPAIDTSAAVEPVAPPVIDTTTDTTVARDTAAATVPQ